MKINKLNPKKLISKLKIIPALARISLGPKNLKIRKFKLRPLTIAALILLLILSPITYLTLIKPSSTQAAWFDDNWAYRKTIVVTNNTSAESDVYISFDGADVLDTSASGRFQADCGDIRFTKENGELLPYYINSGCGTASTDIDVLFDSFPSGAQNIYMYYGNPSAEDGFESQLIGEGTGWLSGWDKRIELTVLPTNIDSNLTHFPLLLTLGTSVGTNSKDISAVFDEVGSNDKKIAVTKSDGTTEIYVEVEKWDDTGEQAWLWVSKSDLTLSSSANTILYLYYDNDHADNSTYVGDPNSTPAENVWDSSFELVYHLTESPDGTSGEIKDSTGNNRDGTTAGSMDSNDQVTNKLDGSLDFDGSDDYTNSGFGTNQTTVTYEVWFLADGLGGTNLGRVFDKRESGGETELIYWSTGSTLAYIQEWSTGRRLVRTSALTADGSTNYYLAVTYDKSSGDNVPTMYIDGADDTTSDEAGSGSVTTTADSFIIGNRASDAARGFDGHIDEFRIHSTVRSAAWVKASYHSGDDNLVSWGTEVAVNYQEASDYSIGSPGSEEIGPGPAGWWKFDEAVDNSCYGDGAEDSCDATTNQNHGTMTGGTWQPQDMCVIGHCMFFDGDDDVSTITNANPIDFDVGLASGVTFSTWIRVNSDGESSVGEIFDKGTSSYLRVTNEGTDNLADLEASLDLATTDATATVTNGITMDQWHHVAIAYTDDGDDDLSVYIDGALKATGDGSGAPASDANDLLIGGSSGANFHGFIDDFKVYPYERSAAEIKADYAGGGAGSKSTIQKYFSNGLVGYWKLNESSSDATDTSGNNLTLTNNGTTTYVTGKFGNGSEHVPASTQYFSTATTSYGIKTVSFWVNPDNTSNYYISLTSGAYITSSSGTLSATGFTNPTIYVNGTASTTIAANSWQLVTVTTETGIDANQIYVGRQGDNYFDGTLDQVRFYNKALSGNQVQELYNWAPGPVAFWNFDKNTTAASGGGMLAYCDGTQDVIKYKTLDSEGSWSAAQNTADVDAGSTDRRCQSVRLRSSPDSSEKILISSHYDGTTNQYIYAQVWNGTAWGNVQLLDSFASVVYQQYRKYDGTYLESSGSFMAVHSDSSNTPQFSIWNGSSWSTVSNPTQAVVEADGEPTLIVAKARPNTDEVMIAVKDDYNDTNTIYYDGSGTDTTDFTLHSEHGPSAAGTDYDMDFTWSQNSITRGALVFQDSAVDVNPNLNVFTANGSGGGTWGTATENQDIDGPPGVAIVVDKPDADAFLLCAADRTDFDLHCLKEDDGDTTPTIDTTTNFELTTTFDTNSVSRGVGLAYEQNSSNQAIAVYTDSTSTPKLKKYNPGTNTWDASATSMDAQTDTIRVVDLIADPNSDDIAIITRDIDLDVHTHFWDGANDQLYSSGDRANTEHSTGSGETTDSHSADFSWNITTSTKTLFDKSTNANNATLNSGTATSGKYGAAIDLDGSSDNAQITDSPTHDFSETQNFTVEAWIKHDGAIASNFDYILTKADTTTGGYKLYMDDSGDLCFAVDDDATWTPDDSACTSAVDYDNSSWYHVAGVKVGTTGIYLYVNGLQVASDETIATINTIANTNDLYIGIDRDGTSNGWDGVIDEVKIYNYARSIQQINEDINANHPTGGSPIGSQTIHWKFDELYGTTANDSIGNQDGTIDSNLTWADKSNCKINSCLQWDSADEEVSIATALDSYVDFNSSEAFSASAWVYITTMPGSGNQDAIIAKWDETNDLEGYRLVVENDDGDTTGNFEVEIWNDSDNQNITASSSNDSVSQNTWYHLAFTFNGGTAGTAGDLRLYVNGAEIDSNTANPSFLGLEDVASDFTVGEYDANDAIGNNTAFTGYIDEVKIYSSALTASQVKIDMNANAAVDFGSVASAESSNLIDGSGNAPVGYWPMDENTGTSTTYDKSGNGYDGTLTSITQASWVQGKYGSGLSLDGSADFVDIGAGPSTVNSVTFWAKPATTTEYFIDLDGSNYIWVNSGTVTATGFTSPTIYVDGIKTTSLGSADTWHHIAVTSSTSENATDLDIGRLESTDFYQGTIDEVKLYSYALTQAQAAYDYNRGQAINHWKFDDCQGATLYDAGPGSTNGTLTVGGTSTNTSIGTCGSSTGTEAWDNGTTGKLNYSIDLDGADDLIEISSPNLSTDDFAITGWFLSGTPSSADAIFTTGTAGEELGLWVDSDSQMRVFFDGNTDAITTTTTISADTWYHFALTRNSSSVTLYLNGQVEGTLTDADALNFSSCSLYLGIDYDTACSTAAGEYWDGQLDDFRVYHYGLSASQVKKIMIDDSAARLGPSTGSP